MTYTILIVLVVVLIIFNSIKFEREKRHFSICSVSNYLTEALAILTVKYSAAFTFFLSLFALPFKTYEEGIHFHGQVTLGLS